MNTLEKTITVRPVSLGGNGSELFAVNVHPPMSDLAAQGLANALLTTRERARGTRPVARTVDIVGQEPGVGTAFFIETFSPEPRTPLELGQEISKLIDHAGLVEVTINVPDIQ